MVTSCHCHSNSHKNDYLGTEVKDLLGSDRLILWDFASVAVGSPCSSGVLQKTTCLDIHTGHLQNRNFFFSTSSNTQVL